MENWKSINFPRPYGRGFCFSNFKFALLSKENFISRAYLPAQAGARCFKFRKIKTAMVMFLVILTWFPVFVVAQETSPSAVRQEILNRLETDTLRIKEELQVKRNDESSLLSQYRQSREEERVEALRQYGYALIENRLEDLLQSKQRVESVQTISEANKVIIKNNLETSYLGLSDLKVTIEATSTVSELRPLIESIFYQYRVYVVEIPRGSGLVTTASVEYLVGQKGKNTLEKIEERVKQYKSIGLDTTKVDLLLIELQTELIQIQNDLDQARSNFEAMKPDTDTTQSNSYLIEGRKDLVQAKKNIQTSKETVSEILEAVKELEKESTT